MPSTFEHTFDTPVFKGKTSFNTGLFINNEFVDGSEGGTIDVVNPATGKLITKVSEGTAKDVDKAVAAAKNAYKTVWGLNTPGSKRGRLLAKLADLLEANQEEIAALEALNVGKTFLTAKMADMKGTINCFRYYAGWADKIHGKVIETDETKFSYSRHEPFGVVAGIVPWNFPLTMLSWKIAPAVACGNTIILKPSEITPLTAIRVCSLFVEAGFPPGVINIVTGYGPTVGQAISEHMEIQKVAFTGSTLTGRRILEASAKSNLKKVTLELGGKSPNIVFDDADLEQAVKWAVNGIYFNQGQVCTAGSRLFVQESIYDKFLEAFAEGTQALKTGDPFAADTFHGPQVSETQFNRILGYIDAGKKAGATIHQGGLRHGSEGFFIQPTIFTDTKPDMSIVREEIFGPVVVIIKFKDEEDVIAQANDTTYGLAAALHTKNLNRALKVAHALEAGSVWINGYNLGATNTPFGGYKMSGIGRENGEYALANYTQVKSVIANIGITL